MASANLVTPVATLGFEKFLFEPDNKGVRRAELFFDVASMDKDEKGRFQALVDQRDAQIKAAFVKKTRTIKPGIKKVDLGELDEDEEDKYGWQRAYQFSLQPTTKSEKLDYMNVTCGKMTALEARSLFYQGCKVRAIVACDSYNFTDDTGTKIQGVKFYLNAIQFVAEGERLFAGSNGGGESNASLLAAAGGIELDEESACDSLL